MIEFNVDTKQKSSKVVIENGILTEIQVFKPFIENKKVMLVADSNTTPLFLEKIYKAFAPITKELATVTIQSGEASKNWHNLYFILTKLLENNFNRDAVIVAVGGGMITDLAGFAAAIYQRGVDLIQIPTSFWQSF